MAQRSAAGANTPVLWTRQLHKWAEQANREKAEKYRQRGKAYGINIPRGLGLLGPRYEIPGTDASRWNTDAEYWRAWSQELRKSADEALKRARSELLGSKDAVGRFESAVDYAWFADMANSLYKQLSIMAGTFRHRGYPERHSQWVDMLGWMADWCDKRADWHKIQARGP